MAKSIKLRAKAKDDVATVKALISHPIETGLRKDKKTGKPIPAEFIQEVVFESAGKTVLNAQGGSAISKNPFISFRFSGAKSGDSIKVSWVDNKGNSDSLDQKIK